MKKELKALVAFMTYRNRWKHRLMGNGSIVSHRSPAYFEPLW